MEGSVFNSWHQFRAKLFGEGRESIECENSKPKLPLEIRNEEIVGLTKEFYREEESITCGYEAK